MKCEAVSYRIIKPAQLTKFVVPVILKAGIDSYFLPYGKQLVKKLIEFIFIIITFIVIITFKN